MHSLRRIDVEDESRTDAHDIAEPQKVLADGDAGKYGPSLTLREREVLHWLALGKSARDISRVLDISVCTVRAHIRNIFQKLDASNIPHAIARAFKSGIFDL